MCVLIWFCRGIFRCCLGFGVVVVVVVGLVFSLLISSRERGVAKM